MLLLHVIFRRKKNSNIWGGIFKVFSDLPSAHQTWKWNYGYKWTSLPSSLPRCKNSGRAYDWPESVDGKLIIGLCVYPTTGLTECTNDVICSFNTCKMLSCTNQKTLSAGLLAYWPSQLRALAVNWSDVGLSVAVLGFTFWGASRVAIIAAGGTDLYCHSKPPLTSGKLCFIINFIGGPQGGGRIFTGGRGPPDLPFEPPLGVVC